MQPIKPLLPGCSNEKAYEGHRERSQSLAELKKRIRKVWEDAHGIVALGRVILRFRSKLQAFVTKSD